MSQSSATINAPSREAALDVRDLDVAYRVRGINRQVLRSLSFTVAAGESYGLVGESGCGKSTAALAAVRYLPRNGRVLGGSVSVDGRDLLTMRGEELRRTRASAVSMVYQDPGRALNPSIQVGRQVAEVYEIAGAKGGAAREQAEQMLRKVQIADPGSVMRRYPHQLSGGMQQRIVIAMALASNPALLILDEPTTGLDATVEAEVLELVAALRQEFSSSVLFISHNLAVIAKMCDRVGVLYAGKLVEEGVAQTVFNDPRHPYTVGLLRCIPRGGQRKDHGRLDTIPGFLPVPGAILPGCVFADRCAFADDRCRTEPPPPVDVGGGHTSRCWYHEKAQSLPRDTPSELPSAAGPASNGEPVLRVEALSKTFRQSGQEVHALTGVSLAIHPGETLGLVGESGSGKTTLARCLLGITAPDEGHTLELEGAPLAPHTGKRSGEQVRAIQIVFQNPDAALNRRHTVRRIIGRALTKLAGLKGAAREQRLQELTQSVKLAERFLSVRPSSLSGGLKQRVAIARAFAGNPKLVVCDEPTSALDVSVQAAILNLLAELQRDHRVSYLFISHDLGVVRYLSDRIAVLYLGRLMEVGAAEVVFGSPHHPYTEALLSAVPTIEGGDRARIKLEGD
ncbi:MAG: peptide/nickel transport system ATP-binding protein ddpF, partial [Gaiellales bacterium]|nr:peptide/nickel transport system ATP-binding protein ddpF [Gaiellales bacterium]